MLLETYKLDLKDKKILAELDKDSRQSCSKIAKKVGLSTEVVNYRIKRLEKENIIKDYVAIINLSKLGIKQFKILLSLEHLTQEKLNSKVKQLVAIKNIKWIATCKGKWDLVLTIYADSLDQIVSLKRKVVSIFGNTINQQDVSLASFAEVYNRDFILNKEEKLTPHKIIETSQKAHLDNLDYKILKILSANARKPLLDISAQLDKPVKTINYRIKRLIQEGIITGFRISLNYKKLGMKFYKAFIELSNSSEENTKELLSFIKISPNITHNMEVVGEWDFEPEFETYSEEEFDKIVDGLKSKFSKIIKRIEVITISKEHKFVYL